MTPAPPPPHRRWRRFGAVAAVTAAVVVVAGCMPFVFPGVLSGVRSNLPWFPAPPCTATHVVEVVAAPLVSPTVSSLTAPLEGRRLDDGTCLSVRVRTQDPSDTVASSSVLTPSDAPELWVSDSSLWPAQITKWKQRTVASFASTPVIMVSGGAAVTQAMKGTGGQGAGWMTSPNPSWIDLFAKARPLAIPNLAGQAQGQLALIALWQAAGKGSAADKAVAAAALAAGRATFSSDDQALSAIINPADPNALDAAAPFVVTTEQSMISTNQRSTRNVLTPIYPREGSTVLDFPVVRIGEERDDASERAGADLVVAALTSPQARDAARALGLRDPSGGNPPTGQRGLPPKVAALATPSPADLGRFLQRLRTLSVPSRLLVAIDVSLSMNARVPGANGATRVEVAGTAAAGVGDALPDTSSAGLWAFAVNMDGDKPYKVLADTEPLGASDDGLTHRQVLQRELLGMSKLLNPNGTGLYATALAAVRAQRASFDARAANAVVLFTDGINQDPAGGLTLNQLVTTLRTEAAADPGRPVRLICVGLGPDVNLKELTSMAEATGGNAYQAITSQDLQTVLYDVMSRRN